MYRQAGVDEEHLAGEAAGGAADHRRSAVQAQSFQNHQLALLSGQLDR
jgi:hypothetical protein